MFSSKTSTAKEHPSFFPVGLPVEIRQFTNGNEYNNCAVNLHYYCLWNLNIMPGIKYKNKNNNRKKKHYLFVDLSCINDPKSQLSAIYHKIQFCFNSV